jgi:hypothetical protein
MVIVTLYQIIDERISFLKEQINPRNKPEVNSTLQIQIDAIRSAADDLEKVEAIIAQRKSLLKDSKDVQESDRLFAELDGLGMAAAANSSILLRIKRKKQKQAVVGRCCSICGKKLKFTGTSEYLLICWKCLIVSQCRYLKCTCIVLCCIRL